MKSRTEIGRKITTGAAVLAAIGILSAGTVLVHADSGNLDMSTDYPGITMKAGESTSFDLNFASLDGESCDAELSIVEIPDGWEGYFRGSSSQITKVHINGQQDGEDQATAVFGLTVPADTTEGTYEVKLKADAGESGSDVLDLEIVVDENETGQSSFSSEYPEQQGASGTSFSFDMTLVNNRGTEQTYSLAADAPAGWQVAFVPSGESTQVASVSVESGASQGLTVSVTPPETITEGEYTIPCTAVSATDNLSVDLKVTITGSYDVELTTDDGKLSFDAYSNVKKSVKLVVKNNGNVDLENLTLSSSAPSNWEVTFSEDTIDSIAAGESKEVTAYVTADEDAMTGDYVTTFSVSNDETKDSAEFRVSVKVRTAWGFAAAGIIVVLLGCLYFIFKKYGRR